jgi:hypothetical protein
MTRLWSEEMQSGSSVLRAVTLDRLGGAERIVHTHLDHAMRSLSAEEQSIAAQVFQYLVTPSGTQMAHTAADLASYCNLPLTPLLHVLENLARSDIHILRLITPAPNQPEVPRYEISHDVLAPAILDWRMRYERARELERVHKRSRRLRGMILGLATVGLLLTVLAVEAYRQRAVARRAAESEAALRQEAEEQRAIAERNSLDAQRAFEMIAEQAQEEARHSRDEAAQLREIANRAIREADVQRKKAESLANYSLSPGTER